MLHRFLRNVYACVCVYMSVETENRLKDKRNK